MDSSPAMSIGEPRVTRAALLATTATGTNDRRVVFLGSSPNPSSNLETRTWPHNWSPSTVSKIKKKNPITYLEKNSILD